MSKKIKTLDQAPVDVIEAVKRGFIHRGYIPHKYQRNDPLSPEFILDNQEPEKKLETGGDNVVKDSPNNQNVSGGNNPNEPSEKTIQTDSSSQDGSGSQDKNSMDQGDTHTDKTQEQSMHKGKEDSKKNIPPRPNNNSGKSEGPMHTEKSMKESKPGENKDKVAENVKNEETPEGGQGGNVDEWPPQNLRNDITSTDPEVSVIDSEKGSQEAAKDPEEDEPGKIHEKLIDITEKAHDVLFQAETVFPLTLFPHTISIDREKLTIASRSFFRTAKILTVPLSSMISAEAQVGPFFGAVKMTSKYFVDNTHSVQYLWRQDATAIHRLLQGYIIAHEKGLEVHGIEKEDLKVLLEDLGQGVQD